jgi:7-cyano-7-deazaguanine synthase
VNETVPVTVLLSGGMDSAACVAFYRAGSSIVSGLFVDYGQPAAKWERAAANAIATLYGIELDSMTCSGLGVSPIDDVPGRNAFLYSLGLMRHGLRPRLISSGIHAGTPHYDCSPDFVERMDGLVQRYTQDCVRAVAPFLGWSKRQIAEFCRSTAVPVELTRSCDGPEAEPCGCCASCRDRAQLL